MEKYIAETAKIGKDCILGHNIVILDNVQIGNSAYVGHNVVIHEGTKIGNGTFIDDACILGKMPRTGVCSRYKAPEGLPPLEIGNDCTIHAGVILYAGVKIGNQVLIGDLASIRQYSSVGDKSIIGRLTATDPKVTIGARVKVEALNHLALNTIIEDDVFVSDGVMTADNNTMGRGGASKGPYIKRGARIGIGAILLPGVVIGKEAVVAAGAVVTHDVPDRKMVMGMPARVVRDIPEDELLARKKTAL